MSVGFVASMARQHPSVRILLTLVCSDVAMALGIAA